MIKKYILLGLMGLVILAGHIHAKQIERTFYFKNGEKLTGTVLSIDDQTGIMMVQTSMGSLSVDPKLLHENKVQIWLLNGDQIKGILLEESNDRFKIKSQFGEITVEKVEVDRIYFEPWKTGSFSRPGSTDTGRWYFGKEQLIDTFFDPTGHTLENNVLYLSGLSWGYGITDRLQITTKYWDYFFGNINIRPKFQVYKSGDINHMKMLSVGVHAHMSSQPNKYVFSEQPYRSWDDSANEYTVTRKKVWSRVGESYDSDGYLISNESSWGEVFMAYTVSRLKKNQQGRTSYTLGTSITGYKGTPLLPRVNFAIDSDVRRNLKLIFNSFYDPHFPSIDALSDEKEIEGLFGLPIQFDFGFILAFNEHFRVGIHTQRPIIAFYYKF